MSAHVAKKSRAAGAVRRRTVRAAEEGFDAAVRRFLRGHWGARAETARISPLAGDASTRRYYRVQEGRETSVVALYPEPFDGEKAPFLVVHGLLAGWGVPVPRILGTDGGQGVMWQEDLGDVTLQGALLDATDEQRHDYYRQALDQLVRLQREAAQGPQGADCFQIAFDFEKLSWELHFFWKHFLEAFRGCDLSVEDRALVADGFHRLASEIASCATATSTAGT
jgi:aminoglycoside/choline kinase family phosphotransferase